MPVTEAPSTQRVRKASPQTWKAHQWWPGAGGRVGANGSWVTKTVTKMFSKYTVVGGVLKTTELYPLRSWVL